MLTPLEAPSFDNLTEAREWAYNASLAEPFYLVEAYPNLFEFWSLKNIQLSGGLELFKVIEVWS